MSIQEALSIYHKNGYDKKTVYAMTESKNYYHFYNKESFAQTIVFPFAAVNKNTHVFELLNIENLHGNYEFSALECDFIEMPKEV